MDGGDGMNVESMEVLLQMRHCSVLPGFFLKTLCKCSYLSDNLCRLGLAVPLVLWKDSIFVRDDLQRTAPGKRRLVSVPVLDLVPT